MEPGNKIIVAIDDISYETIPEWVEKLIPLGVGFKVGLEFICAGLADVIINLIRVQGGWTFFDGKLNDIPNTVGKAAKRISEKEGVCFFNLHASCGAKAMEAAVENKGNCKVLAVTVLTSIDEGECECIFGDKPESTVLQFAIEARDAGVDGIICSPKELRYLRGSHDFEPDGPKLLIVTPGIRAVNAPPDDQKRTMTPGEAIRAGADYLVIGRPITKASDPVEATKRIIDEIAAAMGEVEK